MADVELSFKPLISGRKDCIAVLTLNRPESANAFNGLMINAISAHMDKIAAHADCRALVIRGKGKHFSAGADLGWMQASAKLNYHQNLEESSDLTRMFELVYRCKVPTIAVAHGSIFGGGVGLIACCDIVLATPDAKFCLSEVRLGLLPAVILPYVARRMQTGPLRRLSLSARRFSAEEGQRFGLVDLVVPPDEMLTQVSDELKYLLQSSPKAQKQLKGLHQHLLDHSSQQSPVTAEAIASARTGVDGQAGLSAYFAKQAAPWLLEIDPQWKAYDN